MDTIKNLISKKYGETITPLDPTIVKLSLYKLIDTMIMKKLKDINGVSKRTDVTIPALAPANILTDCYKVVDMVATTGSLAGLSFTEISTDEYNRAPLANSIQSRTLFKNYFKQDKLTIETPYTSGIVSINYIPDSTSVYYTYTDTPTGGSIVNISNIDTKFNDVLSTIYVIYFFEKTLNEIIASIKTSFSALLSETFIDDIEKDISIVSPNTMPGYTELLANYTTVKAEYEAKKTLLDARLVADDIEVASGYINELGMALSSFNNTIQRLQSELSIPMARWQNISQFYQGKIQELATAGSTVNVYAQKLQLAKENLKDELGVLK